MNRNSSKFGPSYYRRIRTVLEPVLMVVAIFTAMFWFMNSSTTVSAASPIYVRQGGNDTLCNGTSDVDHGPGAPNCAFRTIQHGIDTVDIAGQVFVRAGTYDESVVLNRNVSVEVTADITITGDLSIVTGFFIAPTGTLSLQGDFTRDNVAGFFNRNHGTVRFNGSSPQTVGGSAVLALDVVVIDNPSNVTLSYNLSFIGQMQLLNGNLILGSHNLELGAQATFTPPFSSSNMIITNGIGAVCKGYPNGLSSFPTSTFTFPIGESTGGNNYSPATIFFSSGIFGTSPTVCVRVVDAAVPANFFPAYLTRHWVMSSENITNFSATVGFTYVDGGPSPDVVGTESNLLALRLTGVNWDFGGPVNPATDTFSFATTGLSIFTAGGSELNENILFESFTTTPKIGGIQLDWATSFENNLQGFNIYRATDPVRPLTPLNGSLIPALSGGGTSTGGSYPYFDATASAGIQFYYWLGVLPEASAEDFFGPLSAIWFYNLNLPIVLN